MIEQTIREKLPEGFQRSEYLKEHGMVDMVVHRHDLPETIAKLCATLTHLPWPILEQEAAPDTAEVSEEPVEASEEEAAT